MALDNTVEGQPASISRQGKKRLLEVASLIPPTKQQPKQRKLRGKENVYLTPEQTNTTKQHTTKQHTTNQQTCSSQTDQKSGGQTKKTPIKLSIGATRSTGTHGLNRSQVENVLVREAKGQMDEYLKRGIKGIIEIASPDETKTKDIALQTADSIASLVETLFGHRDLLDIENQKKSKQCIKSWLKQHSTSIKPPAATVVNKLYSLFAQFHRLIPMKSKRSRRGGRANAKKPTVQVMVRNELQMYEPVKAFVCFVSECIRLQASPETLPKRLVEPFGKTDVRPKDSEHDWRIEIALRCVPFQRKSPSNPISNSSAVTDPAKLEERPEIADTFAYMELKYRKKNMDDALAQLFRYTKEIYMAQHDRRFVWGIAMCSSVLQSCVFGSNYAAASENMDIAVSSGRKAFVQLLVNWSFCESHKLGYDPTISYDYKAHCLAIQATSSDRNGRVTTKTFYSREVLVCAERMFGRHTRCFKATATKPLPLTDTDASLPHEQMADCNVIIKDAWAEAPENADEDPRDEARHLAIIKAGLADVPSVCGMYPELCSDCDSGRVRFMDPLSKASYEDTTKTALGENVWSQISESTALRVHKRNFIQGVGKPIKYVRSVPELVIVAADVMRCHWELIDKCGVLHRDISVNNILVRRGSDGDARGMLIDFDHSISIDTVDGYPRAERTGTLQFMSIRNLENTNLKPTALDDWESMLYILCWLGTYGWNSKTRLSDANAGRLSRKVERWCTGPLETISDAKRSDLDSENDFQLIIQDFNLELENIDLLFDLAARLRSVLIEEHSDELRGALTNTKFQFNKETRMFESVVISDPFEKRSEKWKDISKLLLQEMEKYAQLARERLSSN